MKTLMDFWLNGVVASHVWYYRIRNILYSVSGLRIGKGSAIYGGCYFSGTHFEMGSKSYLNRNCTIDCEHGKVVIGNKVGIAYNVQIYTTQHDYSLPSKRTGTVRGIDVIIDNGSWIGGGTIICLGVTIGKGCVIAAGSVVTRDCKSNCIYGGNPARLIRELEVVDDA